jgi:hypothetical protein
VLHRVLGIGFDDKGVRFNAIDDEQLASLSSDPSPRSSSSRIETLRLARRRQHRRTILPGIAAVAMIATPVSAKADDDVMLVQGEVAMEDGSAYVWATLENHSRRPASTIGIQCTFFTGQRPITTGGDLVTNLKPGEKFTFRIGGNLPIGNLPTRIDRAECRLAYVTFEH